MKCKSWSNKINNFVVRRLKSIKINGQPQPHTQIQSQQQQQQQQYSTNCCAMPAMSKDKATAAVSLSENNFNELKLKELATSAAVVVAMASTATAAAANHRLQSNVIAAQQQQQQQRNICGCGAASAEVVGSFNRNNYMTNGHSSPLAAAVAAQQNGSIAMLPTPAKNCCRSEMLQQQQRNGATMPINVAATNGSSMQQQQQHNSAAADAVAPQQPKKSPKDFIFGRYIGEGSFSIVYLAVDVNTKREYAIKVCKKSHILREHKQDYILREREVLHMMTNVPGFVNLSCTFQDESSLFFVMTYAKNGDVLPYINKVGSFDVDCTRHYAAELVLACEQLHSRNVVHRDLKPENILLDEDMHTLIADFGSSKILTAADREAGTATYTPPPPTTASTRAYTRQARTQTRRHYESSCSSYDDDDEEDDYYDNDNNDDLDDEDTNDTGSDDVDSPSRRPRYHRKRKGSFVGTAQYVSPEVLQNGPITPAADLWALGCIIYQMISGLPPFRGSNDYVIFKEILACNLDFPQDFDKDAEDLVRQLVMVNPQERLGAQDIGDCYESIRAHPFFANIDFATIRQQTPPPIYPYLPGVSKDDNFRPKHYRVPENLEPGLDEKQLMRLLGMELGTSIDCVEIEKKKTATRNIFDLTDTEKQRRLEQQKSDKWHVFADNEVILKKGFVNKRKGLFARKRMLLLTTGPRLIYIDPVQMVKKGEIPWSSELRVEPKNFKIFFVLTPNRTYYLDDPHGYSLEWVEAIEKMREFTYKIPTSKSPTQTHSVTRTSAELTTSAAFATAVKTASN